MEERKKMCLGRCKNRRTKKEEEETIYKSVLQLNITRKCSMYTWPENKHVYAINYSLNATC